MSDNCTIHYSKNGKMHAEGGEALCGQKNPDGVTTVLVDVTCQTCLKRVVLGNGPTLAELTARKEA